ncbi:hypothetical protein PV10_08560 [Exophiala mesophila]|uniref:Uncharacterized protein n=1 Tax=Exophiala mesophila TaxID=212818 RepID=A0A0D1Z4U4_EXOME|nr:uncharacterized protein PV10_08560 [Exophiala mesophila]KIV88934.1 hypothetical protein PV10_08560 [Exophiala mesophila]
MTTILITGANRGIGRGIADIFLSRPNTTLIALVRDTSDETTKSLKPLSEGSAVVVLPYDASDNTSAQTAIEVLQTQHHITSLDIVIANAGIQTWQGPSIETPPEAMMSHFQINTIAPLQLFKATLPLLQHRTSSSSKTSSPSPPKFFTISSSVGSTELIPQRHHLRVLPYATSKAAVNHVMHKLHSEHPEIVIELLAPGYVATNLSRGLKLEGSTVNQTGMVPIEDSTAGLVKQIDMANLENTKGALTTWKGEVVPW